MENLQINELHLLVGHCKKCGSKSPPMSQKEFIEQWYKSHVDSGLCKRLSKMRDEDGTN